MIYDKWSDKAFVNSPEGRLEARLGGHMKASKGKRTVAAPPAPKKKTVKEQLETLKTTIREYFSHLRYRQPEYSIRLNASIKGENGLDKVHMVNVPSLIASITTAQHLQKEIRVRAVEDPTGGALLIEFFTPVQIERNGPMLMS